MRLFPKRTVQVICMLFATVYTPKGKGLNALLFDLLLLVFPCYLPYKYTGRWGWLITYCLPPKIEKEINTKETIKQLNKSQT